MDPLEKTQADFDLEKMFEMIDEALTSKDERVQNALRGLLTIIALTRPQADGSMAVDRAYGPLRSIQEDLKNLTRRLNNLEGIVRQNSNPWAHNPSGTQPYNPYGGQGVGGQPWGYPTYTSPTYTGQPITTTTDGFTATPVTPTLWNGK